MKNYISKAIDNNNEMIINGFNNMYAAADECALAHHNLSCLPIFRLLSNIFSIARDYDIQKFDSILEVGCGSGHITKWLMPITSSIIAFDASIEAIESAKRSSKSDNVFLVGDGLKPETVTTCKFDLIVISEFTPFKRPILPGCTKAEYDEMYSDVINSYIKILNPGGLLIFANEVANTSQRINPTRLKVSLPVIQYSPRKYAIEDLVIYRPIANILNNLLLRILKRKYTNFYIINK